MGRYAVKTNRISFIIVMIALGNTLSIVSTLISLLHPQLAVDLSHIATVLTAFLLGPTAGFIVGFFSAIVPYYRFGITGLMGPVLGLAILPGKGLTGLTIGLIKKRLKITPQIVKEKRYPVVLLITLIGYIPEAIFTFIYLGIAISFFVPFFSMPLVIAILVKAWIEMFIIGFICEAIYRHVNIVFT